MKMTDFSTERKKIELKKVGLFLEDENCHIIQVNSDMNCNIHVLLVVGAARAGAGVFGSGQIIC